MNLYEKLNLTGLIPVVKLKSADSAVPLADALAEGGLEAAEITFRTDAAEESIRRIAKAHPDFLLAAGTVLNTENADRAMDAGAGMIVSPGLNPKVVEHCLKKGYPVIPGVTSPTEIELALSLGLDRMKFFPAEAMGGVKMLKALSAPYTMVKFMPTGGVDEKNLLSYLALPCVFCCGGSWMVKGDWIDGGRFDQITAKTREAVQGMLDLKLCGAQTGENTLLDFTTPDPKRAVYYLSKQGFTPEGESLSSGKTFLRLHQAG